MANIIQPLPSKAGVVGDLARMYLRLMGPAYPAPDLSANAADATALATALSASRDTTAASLAEAFPDTAVSLLSEWERMLRLPVGTSALSTAARQARLLARWRTRFAGTPNAILSALTPLNGGSPPTLRETLAIDSHANPARVFGFTLKIIPDVSLDYAVEPLRDVVDVMKPAHTAAHFTNNSIAGGFRISSGRLGNTVL